MAEVRGLAQFFETYDRRSYVTGMLHAAGMICCALTIAFAVFSAVPVLLFLGVAGLAWYAMWSAYLCAYAVPFADSPMNENNKK